MREQFLCGLSRSHRQEATMPTQQPPLVDILSRISTQLWLAEQDASSGAGTGTIRARLEAIVNFASQGINELTEMENRPKNVDPFAVE